MQKLLFALLAFCLSACGAAPAPIVTPLASNPTHAATTTKRPWVIAHRGGVGGSSNLENTAQAFASAIRKNADFIELDTHLSKDGAVIVIHDETIDRITDGRYKGRIADKTRAEIQVQLLPPSNNTQPFVTIPTLGEVFDLLKGNTVRAEVEIKTSSRGRYAGIEEKVVKEIVDRNLLERVQVSSFNFEVLKDLKRINPQIKTVALMTGDFFRRVPVDFPAKVVDEAQAVGATVIAIDKSYLTPAVVGEAQQRGLKVEVWTVDNELEMKRFVEMGVDGIITNQPDVLLRLTR